MKDFHTLSAATRRACFRTVLALSSLAMLAPAAHAGGVEDAVARIAARLGGVRVTRALPASARSVSRRSPPRPTR